MANKNRILTTDADNSQGQGSPTWNTEGGNSTQDELFLLGLSEAERLFGSAEDRRCAATPFAKENGAESDDEYRSGGRKAGWWWLRSPGFMQRFAARASSSGSFHSCSVNDYGSVRPALWINPGFSNLWQDSMTAMRAAPLR